MKIFINSPDGDMAVCKPKVRFGESGPMTCERCGREIPGDGKGVCAAVPLSERWKIVDASEFYEHLQEAAKTFNGREWAKQFVDAVNQNNLEIDEELMEVWFCNALMIGYDMGRKNGH